MDFPDDEDYAPTFATGRIYTLAFLIYGLGIYFFFFEQLPTLLKVVYSLGGGIFLLLSLRQKVIFFEHALYIKHTAKQPFNIAYDDIDRLQLEGKWVKHLAIYSKGEKLTFIPLLFESKKKINDMTAVFCEHGINDLTRK